jgi:winged helix DNA-binding protein
VLEVDRKQVIAYRMVAHQFDRSGADQSQLAVLDLGVQDPRHGTALTALAARLPKAPTDDGLVSTWTFRGAPHLHRASDLPELNRALWPLDDTDAGARLGNSCAHLVKAGMPPLQAIRDTAQVWRKVAGKGVQTKGELSGALTKRLPDGYAVYCRACRTEHVTEQLMRLAGLPAGAVIAQQGPPVAFQSQPDWPGVPAEPVGTARLLEAYLTLHGPATAADAAGYLGTKAKSVSAVWPDGLVEVQVGRRKTAIPEAELEALTSAPKPRLVRLLPPYDPYLQGRDRDLLVPDRALHKQIWQILGNPWTVLVDGEIAGAWRAKSTKSKLTISITPFARLRSGVPKEIEREASRVADVRGIGDVEVRYPD